jgi:hypothetical protein
MRIAGVLAALAIAGCSSAIAPGAPRDAGTLDVGPPVGDGTSAVPDAPRTGPGTPVFPVDEAARECEMSVACARVSLTGFAMTQQDPSPAGCAEARIHEWATTRSLGAAPSARDSCLAAANDCTAFWNCFPPQQRPAFCAAHPEITCDGDVWVECALGVPLVFDCGAFGAHCTPTVGPSRCTFGEPCADGTRIASCDGSVVRECDATTGLVGVFDCATDAPFTRCVAGPHDHLDDPEVDQPCAYPRPGGACIPPTVPTGPQCDGTRAFVCGADGTRYDELDCAVAGATCTPDPSGGEFSGSACTLPGEPVCDRERDVETCDGATVTMCIFGRAVSLDCRAIGMRTCATDYASTRCVP